MKKHIIQECSSCGGTGLYCGFAEAKGEAVICMSCTGRGWFKHWYNEFTGRKKKRGIKSIKISRGTFVLTGVGGYAEEMTYAEFEKKYPEKK